DICATCHVHATCHQIEGKSVCICNYGFVGNGRTHCQDKDECQIGASKICGNHTLCHNTHGSFYCVCLDGYRASNNNKTFIPNDGTNCTDIDECEDSGLCGRNARCVNTEGSYKCYCNDGYKLENGEHSFHPDGNIVSCKETGCGSPPEMKHGYIVGSYSSLPGSAVHYECKEGFYSNEGKFSYCTANGAWEPATLSCKGVNCGVPPSVLNAHLASVSGTTYGSEVTYNCIHGYFIASGNQTAVCNARGQWDGADLVCKEEELFSNLSIFNETCVKWQRKTGKLGLQETYTVSGAVFETGISFVLVNSRESAVDNCFVGFACMVICFPLPSELPRNLKVAGFGEKKIPVLKLCEKTQKLLRSHSSKSPKHLLETVRSVSAQVYVLFHIQGQRWDEKTFSEDAIFNITTSEDNPKVCLDLNSGSNYVVNITTISSTNITVSVTVAVQTKVKEALNNVFIFNDTCLKWRRNVRGTDVEDRYSFHVQGQRWYQKEFFHEMTFSFTTHKQAPEVCFDLQPGTNYSVNISIVALNFSLLVSMTTQITDPPFPDVEFVAVKGSIPLLRLRKAEDRNGPISLYQLIVLPLGLQSTFICDSFAATTFFSNTTDVKGYVAAEFRARDVADNMSIALGDRHYYGKFYNAPLKLGEEYCVFLRIISEWNKVRTQSCAIWAQIKNLSPTLQYMTAVGLGSVAAVCLILFLSFSAA
ncbi:SUSD1 protein, partial [Podargus strigoides]|nr:SUSD1 protein [Podargus strigoides]